MSAAPALPLATEPTPEGEQTLIPGMRPLTVRDRLALRIARTTKSARAAEALRSSVIRALPKTSTSSRPHLKIRQFAALSAGLAIAADGGH